VRPNLEQITVMPIFPKKLLLKKTVTHKNLGLKAFTGEGLTKNNTLQAV
jgi:hypothetical protein